MKKIGISVALAIIAITSLSGGLFALVPTRVDAQAVADFSTANGQDVNISEFSSALNGNVADTADKLSPDICPHWYSFGCQIGVLIFYDIWFSITHRFARMTASLADLTLNLSLQSWVYHNSDFITTGWTIMRDMSNIMFIAGLLYAAFRLMMGDGTGKKIVFKVIFFALMINFSLFFTQLVVDGGNILARSIYQSITVTGANGAAQNTSGVIEVSVGIVNISNPQRIIFGGDDAPGIPQGRNFLPIFYFVSFVGGIINVMMIFMFISMMLIFIGRTVGLMLLMIMVPLTVVSELIPPIKSSIPIKYLKLDGWLDELWGLTLTAPVYIFFLYLIILFWETTANGQSLYLVSDNADWMSAMIVLTIPMLMTFFLLKAAGDATKKLSGEIGGMVSGVTGAALGAAAGLALGAVAGVGSRVVGGLGGNALQKAGADAARMQQLQEKLAKDKKLSDEEQSELDTLKKSGGVRAAKLFGASRVMAAGTKLKSQNFDARNITVGGMNFGNQLQAAGLGAMGGYGGMNANGGPVQGGYNQIAEKAAAEHAARIQNESKLIREAMEIRKTDKKKKIGEYEEGSDADRIKKEKEKEAKELKEGKSDMSISEAKRKALEAEDEIKDLDKNGPSVFQDAQFARLRDLQERNKNGALVGNEAFELADLDRQYAAQGIDASKSNDEIKAVMKSALNDKLNKALGNLSTKDLDEWKTDLASDPSAKRLKEKIAANKTKREADANKIDESIKNKTFLQDDAKAFNDAEKKVNDLKKANAAMKAEIEEKDPNKQLSQVEIEKRRREMARNDAEMAKAQKKADDLAGKEDIIENGVVTGVRYKNAAFRDYARNKRDLDAMDKQTDDFIKQYQKQEIEKLTKSGEQMLLAIAKGVGAGLLAGGIGGAFVGGLSSLPIAGGIGMSAFSGGVVGGGIGGAIAGQRELQSLLARFEHLFLDNSFKNSLREKLRAGK